MLPLKTITRLSQSSVKQNDLQLFNLFITFRDTGNGISEVRLYQSEFSQGSRVFQNQGHTTDIKPCIIVEETGKNPTEGIGSAEESHLSPILRH